MSNFGSKCSVVCTSIARDVLDRVQGFIDVWLQLILSNDLAIKIVATEDCIYRLEVEIFTPVEEFVETKSICVVVTPGA